MKNNKPKIAIVHDFLIKLGGAEKVLEVLHELYPGAPIYTILYDKKGTRGIFEKGYDIRTSYLQKYPKFIRNKQKLLINKFPKAIEKLNFSEYDIVISDSNSFAHGIVTPKSCLHITYCYSPTRYLWDWYHQYLNENKIGFDLSGLLIRMSLYKLRIWDKKASERTDCWIAISKHVAKRIKKYYSFDSEIIYPPHVEEKQIKSNKKDYYIILSRLSPYKKIDLAIEAFNKNGKKLIIIGEGSDYSRLQKLANNNIEFLGYIRNNNTISKYLAEAKALIFPGEEDFGLTPLQAMSQGTPVIAYNKGGVPETVINGKTGLLFDDNNSNSLIKTIEKFEKDISKYKSNTCINRSKEFSSEKFKKDITSYIFNQYNKYDEN